MKSLTPLTICEKDLAVFIGRFSPVHAGHINVVRRMLEDDADRILILIGSSGDARNIRNPWTYAERKHMFELTIVDHGLDIEKIRFAPIEDHAYQNNLWMLQVQQQVAKQCSEMEADGTRTNVALYGFLKDETSAYINAFPQWGTPRTSMQFNTMNATDVRDGYFADIDVGLIEGISSGVQSFLDNFRSTAHYDYIRAEYDFQEKHEALWSEAPYPPTFNTVDALVVQSGHILLIKRRNAPGKGTYALPGGYLNHGEVIEKGAIRELREETKLKVPIPVLEGSMKNTETFSDPKRSTRGRIITHVTYFQLKDHFKLPTVKGADDAERAIWVPLDEFITMRDIMFEDHFSIIKSMLNI